MNQIWKHVAEGVKKYQPYFFTQKVDRVMRVFKTSYMQNCVIFDEIMAEGIKSTSCIFIMQKADRIMCVFKNPYMQNRVNFDYMCLEGLKSSSCNLPRKM